MNGHIDVKALVADANIPESRTARALFGLGVLLAVIGALMLFAGLSDGAGDSAGYGFGVLSMGAITLVAGKVVQLLFDLRTLALVRHYRENRDDQDA